MNFARLESRICLDEGYRAMPYIDTVGVATIGYGTTRILDVPVTLNDPAIPESVARQILRQDLFTACLDAQALFARFDELDHVRQEVLAHMAYNLGRTRLAGFTQLLSAAGSLDYEEMAAQMKDSQWYSQVGQRGIRLYYAMLNGTWT
jgi:lysozyme